MSELDIGKKAPAFTLPDQDGNTVKLGFFAGKWVILYFYPRDDTPGCTKEACEFTATLDALKALDAVVLGCSPDNAERHRRFIEKYKLRITLLSDETHKVMEKYGAWGEKKMYGRVKEGVIRSTVLINPAGRIAHHWRNVRAAGHAEKVKEKLAALRAASRLTSPA